MVKLKELNPIEVGQEVTRLVQEHVHQLCFEVGLEARESGVSSVGHSAALLTEWAQHGSNGEDWTEGMAWDAVQHVCTALYSRAGEPATFGSGPIERRLDGDPETAIECVLLAAWCRCSIAQRHEVPIRALAACASLRVQSVRNLAVQGELVVTNGLVDPDEAARWLSGRGI